LQDAQLDTGARLHMVHSDVARDGHVLNETYTGVVTHRAWSEEHCPRHSHSRPDSQRLRCRRRTSIATPGSGSPTNPTRDARSSRLLRRTQQGLAPAAVGPIPGGRSHRLSRRSCHSGAGDHDT
jgi:hypothetical protein